MSITGLSDPERIYKRSFRQHRNDSGELDVFEAARYFAGYSEAGSCNCTTCAQKIIREERQGWRGGARMSLDVPMRNPLPQQSHGVEKTVKEKKKYKQPSSPGGRLASFLNSLLASRKKKAKSTTTQSLKDEDDSPSGRRRRRSSVSVSHFRISSTVDSKSIYSSSSSGFRTPPPYTPSKGYTFGSHSDHKQVLPLTKQGINLKPTALQNHILEEKRRAELAWLDEEFRFSHSHHEKHRVGFLDGRMSMEKYPSEQKDIRRFHELDDGAESDSSSDLFELQNYDVGYLSSGLPVYETTNMDSIKKGVPISIGPL